MFDHIGLRISDLDASVRFYTATLAPLGYVLCSRDDSVAGFGPKGEPSLWLHLHKGKAAAGAHEGRGWLLPVVDHHLPVLQAVRRSA